MTETADFYRQIIEQWIPIHQYFGFRLVEVQSDFAVILLPAKPEYVGDPRSQRLHGGMIALMMDATGGAAAFTRLPNLFQDAIATVDLRVDYIAPARLEDIQTEARVLRAGQTTIFTDIKSYHPATPDQILAVGRGVYNIKPGNAKSR
ncbi:MAG: PaaI family thioesterase [Bernardetiaceae bacterium]